MVDEAGCARGFGGRGVKRVDSKTVGMRLRRSIGSRVVRRRVGRGKSCERLALRGVESSKVETFTSVLRMRNEVLELREFSLP